MVLGIDHVSVLVSDLSRSLHYYQHILGLSVQVRPDLGFDGAWLAVGETQSIHLLCLPNPDETREAPVHVGRDRHLALVVNNTETIKERLMDQNIPFTVSQSGRDALFCRDPDGNGIELVTKRVKGAD